jgi:chemotaxis-related protein WspD
VPVENHELEVALPVLDDCWNRIGVRGDHSCPELANVIHCHNCSVFARAGQLLFERPPPPAFVDEWTDRLAQEQVEEPGDILAVIVFRVGLEWLALDVRSMIEVAAPRRVHRVPHRRDRALLGIVSIRGELQLCLSMRILLGIESESTASDCPGRTGWLLVAVHEGQRWALAVDVVAGVWRVPLSALSNAPGTVTDTPSAVAQAVFIQEDKRVGCLNVDQLFATVRRRLV